MNISPWVTSIAVEISLRDLECFRRERYRNAFRLAARLRRGLPRVSRRSIGDVLRLAELGSRIIDEYLEVTAWGEERVLRLR